MSLTPFLHVDTPLRERRAGDEIVLDAEVRRHVRTVLRLAEGAECRVADGAGASAPAVLLGEGARLRADATYEPPPTPRLVVAQALAKGRRFDDVVRAGTELGADAFVPVVATRSVVRLEGKADRVVARWDAVARAAAEQSRRRHRPQVSSPRTVAELAEQVGLLVAHPGGAPLPTVVTELRGVEQCVVAVGPEGGWTDAEVRDLLARGARTVGLGPNVLRTEHAAAAALAVLGACTGRWDVAAGPAD
ncbi:RsmE family RNA methyltransferase [Egicoccus halophilus]|uniref:Ribosomal RNA small subunit methyltransferase E n=1 Tax=Egicoccus halophilus TaxID=1670830 RepID=A0A8J3ETC3_9ACTN|nr:RsmE family RNA methyltransferase [Egicoccus halophilus]GGI09253.1 ribosomal RNA small subunit methyltransferase E [Egicoccus halophilus]